MYKFLKKRVLSILLVVAMVLGSVQMTAAAPLENNHIQTMVDAMSLRDKVTQMLMVDFRYWDEDLTDDVGEVGFTKMNDQVQKIVEDYNFGAIIYFAQNLVDTAQSYQLTQDLQAAATKDGGIPLIISADQEGGSVYRLGTGTALPGNMALGAAGGRNYAKSAGRVIGSELSSLGINTTLAPVVDVNNNANNPVIGLRSYSDDPDVVGKLASVTIEGLAEYNVIGCAKHFPGHGDTATDSHYGLPSVDKDLESLLKNELKPYEIAISMGIEMIMTAHILYPQLESDTIVSEKTGKAEQLPATMSDDIITDLLKGDMGFDGIVITDAMNMAGVANNWDQVQAVVNAISAGVDMICMPCTLYNTEDLKDLDAIIDGVMDAVENGKIPMSRIDDAVTRILTVKENRGILEYDASDYSLDKAMSTVGSETNRNMERMIAAAAVTVVKNEENVLPLKIKEDTKVLMLVPYNNEVSQMLMGWNRAVKAGSVPKDAKVDYYRFSSAAINETLAEKLEWADIVIMNSEISSTSGGRMEYGHWLSALPKAVTEYCAQEDKVSVVLSVDKPYDVQLYPDADAILAVYGCKGSSADPTEVLVGGATGSTAAYGPNIIAGVEVALGTFYPQGTLPVDIPYYDAEKDTYDTNNLVYKRGYGLTYSMEEKVEFTDVADSGSYYYSAVYWALDEGITTGTSKTTFEPDANCTRGQIVTFLYRLAGEPKVDEGAVECAFSDVDKEAYYYEAMLWAVSKGITTGITKTTFAPEKVCTRAEMVTFLQRYDGGSAAADCTFTDVEKDAWYYDAVLWAVGNNITTGTSKTTFEPDGECTRGQAVTMIYRYEK